MTEARAITTGNQVKEKTKETPKSMKPCCACPETKKARDECIFQNGEESACIDLIEAHRECMRQLGFKV